MVNSETSTMSGMEKALVVGYEEIKDGVKYSYKQDFDNMGRLIYKEDSDKIFVKYEYDNFNRLTYSNYNDYETFMQYSDGILVYKEEKSNDKIFLIEKYDSKGNMIYRKYGADDYEVNIDLKYDDRGNIIYHAYEDLKEWSEYDDNDNIIHYWNNEDPKIEYFKKYDDKNRLIYHKEGNRLYEIKDSKTYIYLDDKLSEVYFLNDDGVPIYCKDDKNYEKWWEYNKDGSLKNFIDNKGVEAHYNESGLKTYEIDANKNQVWITYNDRDVIISKKNNKGDIEIWEYDDRGNMIHSKDSKTGAEIFMTYNAKNQVIYFKNDRNDTQVNEYDNKDRLIARIKNDVIETYTYDDNNNILKYTNGDFEQISEYDEHNNVIHFKDNAGLEYWTTYKYLPSYVALINCDNQEEDL